MNMTNKEMYEEAFREVGKEYGYENVAIEWTAFKQFKVQWQRSYKWIAFRISDYLKDAPVEIVKDLAESLFEKIKGKEGLYNQRFADYVTAPEFSQTHRPTFIKRSRYLTSNGEGERKNLMDSVNRLVEANLIPADHNIQAVWNKDTRSDLASTYSVLMRTVMVNVGMDDYAVDDSTLDYVIYQQYLCIQAGMETFGTDEIVDTQDDQEKFPNYEEAKKELDRMMLAL